MAGLTVIHLSDLHIGKCDGGPWSPDNGESFPPGEKNSLTAEAERLTDDFIYLRDTLDVPLLTEEMVLLVTGDITHDCKWWQFELALFFFEELRRLFEKKSQGQSLLPNRVLCIPGNHDLRVPKLELGERGKAGADKYRDFKLFLDLVTDYAPHARDFRLRSDKLRRDSATPTNIGMTVPGPLQVRFVDLNSCMAINCVSADKGHSDAKPGFTEESLEYAAGQFASSRGAIRVALMHHGLADLPSEPGDGSLVTQAALDVWCGKHNVKLLLSGHVHREERTVIVNDEGDASVRTRTTGPTLSHDERDTDYAYQVLRFEPDTQLRVYPRERIRRQGKISWEKAGSVDVTECTSIGLKSSELKGGTAPSVPERFLGCSSPEGWSVVSHCESGKFQNYGILSPGEAINAALIQHFGSSRGNLVTAVSDFEVEYPPGTDAAGKHTTAWPLFDKDCVFLVDSPKYNHYVHWVLRHYGAHMAGGRVEFEDNTRVSPHRQEILVCGREFKSERSEGGSLFGDHQDYLLVMRLPGLVPSRPESVENRPCPDLKKTIWVVAGIHSKGSQAGAILFEPSNLPFFVETLMRRCDGEIPDYFEAVYRIPLDEERPLRDERDLGFLNNPEHFRVLRLKTNIATADGQPSGVAARFRRDANWAKIPLETIHFDPVAACNHKCPTCIERGLRDQNSYLSLPTCLKVLCDLKAVGCHRVNLYGGEPTLHPAFPELVRTMSAMGFESLIVTNGSKLHEDAVGQAIIECRKNVQLRVSIDACCDETHQISHGIEGRSDFEEIVRASKRMIREGVHTTVSILLHPHVVECEHFEGVCAEWKHAGARSLVLRPVTNGKEGQSGHGLESGAKILGILDKPDARGFVQTAQWFEKALRGTECSHEAGGPVQPKEYQTCYSAYYRMVVSPQTGVEPVGARTDGKNGMTEVSAARLSWCSYRRTPLNADDKARFGIAYPPDLQAWLQEDRLTLLGKIDPQKHCGDIYCCRHALNQELYESIT